MTLYAVLAGWFLVDCIGLWYGLRRIERRYAGAGELRNVRLVFHTPSEHSGRGQMSIEAVSIEQLGELCDMLAKQGWVAS